MSKSFPLFLRQLATQLSAGVPLHQAVDSTYSGFSSSPSSSSAFLKFVSQLQTDLKKSNLFSEACSHHPHLFPPATLALIQIGETSGKLDNFLNLIAQLEEDKTTLHFRLITGMIYPLILLHLAILIPSIRHLFLEGVATMLYAIFLFLIPLYGIAGIIFISLIYYRRNEAFQIFIDSFLLRFSLFHSLLSHHSASLFSQSLRALLLTGVPLIESVAQSASTIPNHTIQKKLTTISHLLKKEGTPLFQMLFQFQVFPSSVLSMYQTGETSGKLDQTLIHIAESSREEALRLTKLLITVFTTFLYFIAVLLVLFQIHQTLSPILQLYQELL